MIAILFTRPNIIRRPRFSHARSIHGQGLYLAITRRDHNRSLRL